MFVLTVMLFLKNCLLRHFPTLFHLRLRTSGIMSELCCIRAQSVLMQFFWHTQQSLMCCTTKQTLMTLFPHFRLTTWYYAMTVVGERAKALLSELENNSDLFLQKEKPYRDCIFQIGGNEEQYKCDLFWKESQVALFTSDNQDCYEAARNYNIHCIYCADDTVTVRKILDAIKG